MMRRAMVVIQLIDKVGNFYNINTKRTTSVEKMLINDNNQANDWCLTTCAHPINQKVATVTSSKHAHLDCGTLQHLLAFFFVVANSELCHLSFQMLLQLEIVTDLQR